MELYLVSRITIMETKDRIKLLKEALALTKHPEGGYFKEVYRSVGEIPAETLSESFTGIRNYSTSIYYLLTSEAYSSFHKIKQDETWHFYEGGTIHLHMISPEGTHQTITIGSRIEKGEVYQYTVPGNHWFAAEIEESDSYALVGCTVAPGFDFDDFELGKRENLTQKYPQHAALIRRFT